MIHLRSTHEEYLIAIESSAHKKLSWDHKVTDVKRKQVRFAVNLEHRCAIISREDYSNSEYKESWFTDKEMKKMEVEVDVTIKRMEEDKRCKNSTRGLELYTSNGEALQNQRIFKHIDCIMDEQEDQWKLGIFDWERFSLLSRDSSTESRELALSLAQHDEEVAMRMHRQSDKVQVRSCPSSPFTKNRNATVSSGESISPSARNGRRRTRLSSPRPEKGRTKPQDLPPNLPMR